MGFSREKNCSSPSELSHVANTKSCRHGWYWLVVSAKLHPVRWSRGNVRHCGRSHVALADTLTLTLELGTSPAGPTSVTLIDDKVRLDDVGPAGRITVATSGHRINASQKFPSQCRSLRHNDAVVAARAPQVTFSSGSRLRSPTLVV
jgi:hypothetical protein